VERKYHVRSFTKFPVIFDDVIAVFLQHIISNLRQISRNPDVTCLFEM
jgi:hypothetical protein